LRNAAARNTSYAESAQLATTALNVAFGSQDGKATIHDPIVGDWPTISAFIGRISAAIANHPNTPASNPEQSNAETYKNLLEKLNNNSVTVTPSSPAGCSQR
jgi:hypothetical protein